MFQLIVGLAAFIYVIDTVLPKNKEQKNHDKV